jgi:DNA-binding transcriptional LysR family regulator
LDVHYLRVFASVFKHRSFSRASNELNLSQPTVSEHVKNLEEELETRLFDRVGRRVIPTKEAELLYERAVEIIEKLKDIKTDLGAVKGEIKGEIKLGASSIPGAYIIPPLATEFKGDYPEVSFQIIVKNSRVIADMVAENELIVGVVGDKNGPESLQYRRIVEDEMVLVAAPGFIGKKSITPFGLLGIPFIMREEGSGMHRIMEKHHLKRRVTMKGLNVVAVLGSTDSVREAVKSGLGASILSRFAVRDDLEAGRLEEVRVRGIRMKRGIYLVNHKKRTIPGQYRAFMDFLVQSLSSSKSNTV